METLTLGYVCPSVAPIDTDRPLRAWTDGYDTWIGHSEADVTAMYEANGDYCDEGYEWTLLDDGKPLTISDEGGEPEITKTVAEWIAQEGRGLLCSTEY